MFTSTKTATGDLRQADKLTNSSSLSPQIWWFSSDIARSINLLTYITATSKLKSVYNGIVFTVTSVCMTPS